MQYEHVSKSIYHADSLQKYFYRLLPTVVKKMPKDIIPASNYVMCNVIGH